MNYIAKGLDTGMVWLAAKNENENDIIYIITVMDLIAFFSYVVVLNSM